MTENQEHEIKNSPMIEYYGKKSSNLQQARKMATNILNETDSLPNETSELQELFTMYHKYKQVLNEEMKEDNVFSEAAETVKTIKKAEMDRIAPEKAFYELALVIINENETSGEAKPESYNKEYKKCLKHSSKDYCKDFVTKSVQELKEYCIQYEAKKQAVKKELENNTEYTRALKTVEEYKNESKKLLQEMSKVSKLALQEMNRLAAEQAQQQVVDAGDL